MRTYWLLLRSFVTPLHQKHISRHLSNRLPPLNQHQVHQPQSIFASFSSVGIPKAIHHDMFINSNNNGRCVAYLHHQQGANVFSRKKNKSLTQISLQLSSSVSSSFEAPAPPNSHGQPVFPDIDFQEPTGAAESSTDVKESAAFQRNNDPDSVFVVNGSSRGIGLQFVKRLVERTKGNIVACCRSPESAHELKKLVSKYPQRIIVLPLDMENQSSIDLLVENLVQKYQRVDALLNVAGILGNGSTTPGPERTLAAIDRDWMEKSLAVNVIGPVMLTKALSPLMRTIGRRSVTINTNSSTKDKDANAKPSSVPLPSDRPPTVVVNLSARVGSISDNQLGGWYSYRLSKAALNQATKTMAVEFKRQGTWIVALHPGTTNTDLSKPFQKNVREGRLFPVEFTVDRLLQVVESLKDENSGGFYDWAGKALPY